MVLEGLKKLGIAEDDEAEIKAIKDLLKELADAPKDKPRSLELFKKFADLKLCEVTDDSVKPIICEVLVIVRSRTASNTKREMRVATLRGINKEAATITGVVEEVNKIRSKTNLLDNKIMRGSRNSLSRPSK